MKVLEKNIEHIQLIKISFDVNNPRGEKEEQIVSDPEFKKLTLSIDKFGILEPLIVKKDPAKDGFYILIDGERRLRSAIKVAEQNKDSDQNKTAPVLVAKDDADGRILAYQVHMLRKNWGKAAETKSIKTIIADLKQVNQNITDKELMKQLREVTAHTDAEITDLLKLIKYDDTIIEKVLSGNLDMSHLIQIEASFISPLKRKYIELFNDYGEDKVRRVLVYKAEKGLLVNTRFLMDKFKHIFADENHKDQIKKLIKAFLKNKEKNIQVTFDEYLKLNKDSSQQLNPIKNLNEKKKPKTTRNLRKVENVHKKINLSKREENSIKTVRKDFEDIGKKLSIEERDYIAEAIKCFEERCYKAAIVMIWASGISRIISFVSKDFTKFSSECTAMCAINKAPYKHYKEMLTKSGKTSSVEDLKTGVDMPLVLWLLNQNKISMTEYKKLKADYDTRCDCAHPTDIQLSFHEVMKVFNNVYKLFFVNTNL